MQADRHQFLREKEKADRGDARASVYVGLTYLENNPQVVQADASLAAFYLKQASDAGMPQASYWLADLYESGEGIARDAQTARALLEKSAEAGYYLAQRDLAKIYLKEYEPAKMRAAFGYLKEYTDVALRDPSLINPESGDVILYPLMLAIGIFWIKNPKRSRELLQALAAKGYKSAIDTLEAGTIFPPESGYLLTESGLINVDDSEIYIPALMREIMES